jgi:hypothetical protein
MAGLGSLFAPAYRAGNQQSMDDVDQWMAANYPMTNAKVEQTRSPVSFNTGNPAGMVDVEALRSLAQGGAYDFDARRNAIATAVQQQAAAAQTAAASTPTYGNSAYMSSPEGQYFMNEMNRIAANGPPQVAQPTYSDSYGGGAI